MTTLTGRRTVVRDGYLPEREILTAIGPVLPCENFGYSGRIRLLRLIAYQKTQMLRLKKALAGAKFTGHQFHLRKIVSMQMSSRYAAIARTERACLPDVAFPRRDQQPDDGLPTRRDDRRILGGSPSLRTPVPLAKETRFSLDALVARYPL